MYMTIKTVVSAAVVFSASTIFAQAYEIGKELLDGPFWESDPVLFVRKHSKSGFEFTSDRRDGADSRQDGAVTCFGLPVYESRVSFDGSSGIARVELMLYSRGGTETLNEFAGADGKKFLRRERIDKTMTREEFQIVLDTVRKRLGAPGAKPPRVKKEVAGAARQYSQAWLKSGVPLRAVLTWNYEQKGKLKSSFRAGFIRLAVDGPPVLKAGKDGDAGSPVKRSVAKSADKITDNVIDESKGRGDVFVDNVPMVDQGQKGYCAAATAERVLRYYGLQIDEHQVAEAAGTTPEGGTSTLEMKNSVESIGKRFRLGTVVCYGDFDKGVEARIAGLVDEVRVYNKAAKKLRKPEIGDDVYISRQGNTIMYNPSAFDRAADPEVLKEMKVKGAQKSKFTRFRKDVREQIMKGIPLFWGVRLGVYPEPGLPQTMGGHMRLIIGYNDKKNEILYTDSWGAGHEMKRMPADWAWTITRCLMYMKPLVRK